MAKSDYQLVVDECLNLIEGDALSTWDDINEVVDAYISAAQKLPSNEGLFDYDTIKDTILNKHPDSAIYQAAIARGYRGLSSSYLCINGKYLHTIGYKKGAIFDYRTKGIAILKGLSDALQTALSRDQKPVAAKIAFDLAKSLMYWDPDRKSVV